MLTTWNLAKHSPARLPMPHPLQTAPTCLSSCGLDRSCTSWLQCSRNRSSSSPSGGRPGACGECTVWSGEQCLLTVLLVMRSGALVPPLLVVGVCSDARLAWCASSCSCSSQKSEPPKQQQQQQQRRQQQQQQPAARPEQQQQRRQQQQQPAARPERQQQQPQPAQAQRQQEVAADQRLEEQQEGQERGRQQRGVLGGLSRAVLESTQSMGRGLSSATGAVADLASAASGGVAKAANGVADAAGVVVGVLTAPLQGSDGTELRSGVLHYILTGR